VLPNNSGAQSKVVRVGALPERTYKSASPLPPLRLMTRLVAPGGTAIENNRDEPKSPANPARVTPFGSTSALAGASKEKAADTDLAADMDTVHGFALPVHAPDQPENWLPVLAVAVRVTTLLDKKLTDDAVHPESHEMPDGMLVTVP